MIPTHSKAKLPKGFSYPLGAAKISTELGAIPQTESIALTFEWKDTHWASSWRKRIKDLGVVTLIEVTYWDYFNEWRVFVYAVPSEYNVAAREFLLSGPLQTLADTLRAVKENPERFRHAITFHLKEANVS
jgi:hypothetical protein